MPERSAERDTYLSGPTPRVLAHRGLALNVPENTIAAFGAALELGVHYLETDVHASRDGVAVISHDPDLSRVAGVAGHVSDFTLGQLQRLDLGAGSTFPSLAEALAAFPQARFNIDIKSADAAAPAMAAIRDANAGSRVLITSFSERNRRAAVRFLPGVASSASAPIVALAALAATVGWSGLVRRILVGFVALQVPERQFGLWIVTRRTLRAFQRAGVEVHVWTVNDPFNMARLLALGVDGIVTDRADLALAVIRRDADARG